MEILCNGNIFAKIRQWENEMAKRFKFKNSPLSVGFALSPECLLWFLCVPKFMFHIADLQF